MLLRIAVAIFTVGVIFIVRKEKLSKSRLSKYARVKKNLLLISEAMSHGEPVAVGNFSLISLEMPHGKVL